MQISQTDIQTNTSKVKFGTSQNRKRRVQWNKLPWTTQTHRTQPLESLCSVGTRRSPWAPRSSPRSQCTRPRSVLPFSRSRPKCTTAFWLVPCCSSRGSRPWSCARASPRLSAACWRRQSSLSGRWRCSWIGLSRAMIIDHVKNG